MRERPQAIIRLEARLKVYREDTEGKIDPSPCWTGKDLKEVVEYIQYLEDMASFDPDARLDYSPLSRRVVTLKLNHRGKMKP